MYRRGIRNESSREVYSEEHIKRVLTACGIDIESEIDSDYLIFCPYHNNYRTPAGEVAKDTGHFYCFACQESRDLNDFVMHTTKRSFFEARRLIASKRVDTDITQEIDKILAKTTEFTEFDSLLIDRLHQQLMRSDRGATYFARRGILRESMDHYSLGYSEAQDMVTVPIHTPDGICIGFVGRSIEGKEFKNTPGLQKSKTLFNLHRAKRYDKVFIVESSFDAIRIEQVGGHAVATLGASVSKEQIRLLKQYFSSIIVVADNDDAGKAMRDKLKLAFGSQMIAARLPEELKDISDMSDGQIEKFIHQFDDELHYILQL